MYKRKRKKSERLTNQRVIFSKYKALRTTCIRIQPRIHQKSCETKLASSLTHQNHGHKLASSIAIDTVQCSHTVVIKGMVPRVYAQIISSWRTPRIPAPCMLAPHVMWKKISEAQKGGEKPAAAHQLHKLVYLRSQAHQRTLPGHEAAVEP